MKLHAENLIKRYGKRTVVKGVSVEVNQGEIVGLLGPNGAGKTTSFYMIVGLVKPNEGEIYLENERITSEAMYKRAKKGIGYLPQEASVFRKLSVEDNIMSVLEMTDLKRQERKDKLESLLDEFGLQHVRKNRGDLLSGGERRRTEIARALAVDPSFILLDEPFAGVDPIAVEDIQEIVSKLKFKNIGILITDHNVQETLSITDRAYLLFEGNILMAGEPEELAKDPTVRKVYLGENFELRRNNSPGVKLERLLNGYKDFELAFLHHFKYQELSDDSKKVMDKVIASRYLNQKMLEELRNNVLHAPAPEEDHCPRCRSTKLITREVELTNTAGNKVAAYDGIAGKATMVNHISCEICGLVISDPNE